MTDSALVIQKAAIIGAGTMGHGIAQVAAQSGAATADCAAGALWMRSGCALDAL